MCALGDCCYCLGPWNLCAVADLLLGEQIHVEFVTGWFMSTAVKYDKHQKSMPVPFQADSIEFSAKDKLHNVSLHASPSGLPHPPNPSQDLVLFPTLLRLPRPLPPLRPPFSSQIMESNQHGHLYKFGENLQLLQVHSRLEWGCHNVASTLQDLTAANCL